MVVSDEGMILQNCTAGEKVLVWQGEIGEGANQGAVFGERIDVPANALRISRPRREVALIDRSVLQNAYDLVERQRRGSDCNALLAGRRRFAFGLC